MLGMIAATVLLAAGSPADAAGSAAKLEPTTPYFTSAPSEYALPFIRPRGSARVFRWLPMSDDVFDDRFTYAEMNGWYDGLLVELTWSCREIQFRRGAPLMKQALFRANGQLCAVKDIYHVPNEHAARALAINIMVRRARAAGDELPDDPVAAASAYYDLNGDP